MTKQELLSTLKDVPDNAEIVLDNGSGYLSDLEISCVKTEPDDRTIVVILYFGEGGCSFELQNGNVVRIMP